MTLSERDTCIDIYEPLTRFLPHVRLTSLIKDLVDTYLDIPWVETKCGYGCSDHASWNKVGIPSAFGIESAFEDSNKNIHSSNEYVFRG